MRSRVFITCACVLAASALTACDKLRNFSLQGGQTALSAPVASAPAKPEPKPLPAVPGYDGPFGLAMGISLEEMQNQIGYKLPFPQRQDYLSGKPPRPVEGLGDYYAIATRQQGVCRVGASAIVKLVNGSGDQLKAEADKIADLLQVKYGKPAQKFDFKSQDIYVRNPQYWMLGLVEESVGYGYSWSNTKNSPALPNKIASIEVAVVANSVDAGRVDVRYSFLNFADCDAEMKMLRAANL